MVIPYDERKGIREEDAMVIYYPRIRL